MKTLTTLILSALLLLASGCASQTDQVALTQAKLEAFATSMSKCGDNQGCQVAMTAYVFGGGLNTPKEAGPVEYAAAFLPYANLFLNAYSMTLGGGGSANAMYVKGSNNTFIGWNKASADRELSLIHI